MNAGKTGEPILRSLEYEFPHRGYHAVKDEFLMGDDLLVVPMVSPGTRREAVIPPGTWRAGDAARDLPALEVAARAIPISICSAAVTTFRGMSAGESRARWDLLRHYAECRRERMSCFGARCRTPRASLGESFLMFYKTAKMTASGWLQGDGRTTAVAVRALPMGGKRQRGIVASETTVAMKRNDKIGQTGCDKQEGEDCLPRASAEMRRGRRRG